MVVSRCLLNGAQLIRRIRYGLVLVSLALVAWVMYQARGAFVPFIIGGILAFMLAPLVERMVVLMPFRRKRPQMARTFAILLIYLMGAGAMITAGAVIIPAIITEANDFIIGIPDYVRTAQSQTEQWTEMYRQRVPVEVQERLDTQIATLGDQLGNIGQQILNRTFSLAQGTLSAIVGYLVIPFWLFYVLQDRHNIAPAIKGWFPPGLWKDVDECIRIIQRVLGSYIRGQLTLGLFIGVFTTLGLFTLDYTGVVDVQYAVVLGIIAGVTELIPVIGPILGSVPAIIITLATDPTKVWIVVLFYFLVQQIENAVLVPKVQGNAVNLHPALIIMLLVIAQQLAGFFGMLVAVPLAAVVKELYSYTYRRLREREEELAHPPVVRLDRRRTLTISSSMDEPAEPVSLILPDTPAPAGPHGD